MNQNPKLHDRNPDRLCIPLKDCIVGRIYEIQSRNLLLGVYNGNTGFIGIREKFDSLYLSTEYHIEPNGPFSTVRPFRDTGINVPEDILLTTSLGTYDHVTKRPMIWDETIDNPNRAFLEAPSKGWWRFTDGNCEVAPKVNDGCSATNKHNNPLFAYLLALEQDLGF